MKELFSAIAVFLLVAVDLAQRAFAVNVLWGWFVQPIYGIEPPKIVALVGFLLIVSVAKGVTNPPKEEKLSGTKHFFTCLIMPWVVVFIGYIAKSFM